MKKLCVIAAAAVIGMFSLYASGKGVAYKAGTYRETAKGNNGDVTLDVTFSKDAIKSIKVVSHKETPGLSDPAFTKIPDAIVKNKRSPSTSFRGRRIRPVRFLKPSKKRSKLQAAIRLL